LIVEKATDTLRCDAAAFSASGVAHENARYLGPVMQHASGLIQWIKVADLLDTSIQALLFPEVSSA
jgi:chemotaxis-related protein WspB